MGANGESDFFHRLGGPHLSLLQMLLKLPEQCSRNHKTGAQLNSEALNQQGVVVRAWNSR